MYILRPRNWSVCIVVLQTVISRSAALSAHPSRMATSLPSVSSRINRTLEPCVVLMKNLIGKYADQWKDKGGIYSLAQGVVYWKPPETAITAMQEELKNEDSMLHMYGPDEGLPELRQKLEEKIKIENQLLNHDVMITVGANQAYVNAVLTLLQEEDKAVVFKPFYFNHVMALQMSLSEKSLIEGPSSSEGVPDLEWLEEQLQLDSSIKMVTLVNPGNPTGALLPRSVVQRAVDLCRQYRCWLVLDCTYEYFVPDSVFDACFEEEHVLHIFSMSKAYALAGYRCGYIVMHRNAKGLFEQMMKVQDTIPIAPSRISQIAALGALVAGRDWVREKVATLETSRNAVLDALSPLEQIMGGSGAMYVMGKLNEGTDDQEFSRRLVEEFGIAVIPGSYCGFPGWIRVCYANLPPDKCLEAASRLAIGLKELASR